MGRFELGVGLRNHSRAGSLAFALEAGEFLLGQSGNESSLESEGSFRVDRGVWSSAGLGGELARGTIIGRRVVFFWRRETYGVARSLSPSLGFGGGGREVTGHCEFVD